MRAPSEYCATSSGIAMTSIRASTHPDFPSLVRTRIQSSIGGPAGRALRRFFFFFWLGSSGGSGGGGGNRLSESSSQFAGKPGGGGGGGGGGKSGSFFRFRGGGAGLLISREFAGTSADAALTTALCAITSTRTPSAIW